MDTLAQLCAEYLSVHEYDLELSTKETAQRACRWFDASPAACRLAELARAHGEQWRNWLVATGRSRATANMYLRSVKRVIHHGVEHGVWPDHPWSKVRQFALVEKPVTIYEEWQFARMLHFLPRPTAMDPQRDIRWLAILWGARTTGFRRGALLNLTWDNLRGGLVWAEPKKATAKTWPWRPKTGRIVKVPLAPQFAECLSVLKDRHYPLVLPRTAGRLLAGQLAERWRKCPELNFRRTFAGIQRRAFGQQVGDFHQLRRTFTTDLAEYLSDRALMEFTGHTRRETLSRYTAVRRSHWQTAYEVIASIGKRAPEVCSPRPFGGIHEAFRGPDVDIDGRCRT